MIPESTIRQAMGLLAEREALWHAERYVAGCRLEGSSARLALAVGPVELPMDLDVVEGYLKTVREQLDARFAKLGIRQEFRPGTRGP